MRTITANQLQLHRPHAGSRRPSIAPVPLNTSSRFACLCHPGGGVSIQSSLRGDPLLLLFLQLFTSHVGRQSTQEQAVVRSFTTHTKQRERENVSRVNQINTQTYEHQYHITIHTSLIGSHAPFLSPHPCQGWPTTLYWALPY